MTWLPEALPQTLEEVKREAPCPEIISAAVARGITRIVHFTRTRGLIGVLSTGVVKARLNLPADMRVKHVYEENAADRSRDLPWHGYINLSVSSISRRMFGFSKREHPDDEWVVLEFGPAILGDPGVVFCTSNNAYELTHRSKGHEGFEQMFAPHVPWGYYGTVSDRRGKGPHQPTDPQAEVLYPFELSLEHLHRITVGDEATFETVEAAYAHFPHHADIAIIPEDFR